MRFLRPFDTRFMLGRCFWHKRFTMHTNHIFTSFCLCRGRDIGRVGPHIGDQTDRVTFTQVNTFVQLLGNRHRALGGEA